MNSILKKIPMKTLSILIPGYLLSAFLFTACGGDKTSEHTTVKEPGKVQEVSKDTIVEDTKEKAGELVDKAKTETAAAMEKAKLEAEAMAEKARIEAVKLAEKAKAEAAEMKEKVEIETKKQLKKFGQ
jgi:cell division septum initiation protein DivIVA